MYKVIETGGWRGETEREGIFTLPFDSWTQEYHLPEKALFKGCSGPFFVKSVTKWIDWRRRIIKQRLYIASSLTLCL